MVYTFWAWYPDGTGIREEASFGTDKEAIGWMNRLIASYVAEGRALQAYQLREDENPVGTTWENWRSPREIASFNVVAYNGLD
jgi:hypothetical protein